MSTISLDLSNDLERFEQLKKKAVYYSDLTHVVELDDTDSDSFETIYNIPYDENKRTLFFDHSPKAFSIGHATATEQHFFKIYGNKISLHMLPQIEYCMNENLYNPSKAFKETFTKLPSTATFKDLICYNCRNKKETFKNYSDVNLFQYFLSMKKKETLHTCYLFKIDSLVDTGFTFLVRGFLCKGDEPQYKVYQLPQIDNHQNSVFYDAFQSSKEIYIKEPKSQTLRVVYPFGLHQFTTVSLSKTSRTNDIIGTRPSLNRTLQALAFAEYCLRNGRNF